MNDRHVPPQLVYDALARHHTVNCNCIQHAYARRAEDMRAWERRIDAHDAVATVIIGIVIGAWTAFYTFVAGSVMIFVGAFFWYIGTYWYVYIHQRLAMSNGWEPQGLTPKRYQKASEIVAVAFVSAFSIALI